MQTGQVVVCNASFAYRFRTLSALAIALILGSGMVVVAVSVIAQTSGVKQKAAGLPLLTLGSALLVIAVLGWRTRRRTPTRILVEDGVVTFFGPGLRREVPAGELAAFRWRTYEPSPFYGCVFVLVDGDMIRAPRMSGLESLVLALKSSDPGLDTPS
jgi:hypothetical protein